jgi:hypothetical protein
MLRRIIPWSGLVLLLAFFAGPAEAQKFSDWSAPVNLGSTINTPSNESMPFVTKIAKASISCRTG